MNLGLQLYRGENTIKHFLKKLMDAGDKIKELLKIEKPMIITPEQEEEFLKCEVCHICGGKIDDTFISFKNFQFLDSFAFLGSSLDTLVTNLKKDGKENFKHTLNYKAMTEEQQSLILQKGTYPYEYMDSLMKHNYHQLTNSSTLWVKANVKKMIINMLKTFGEHSTSIILVNITIYI
jgi:hypothetical protein